MCRYGRGWTGRCLGRMDRYTLTTTERIKPHWRCCVETDRERAERFERERKEAHDRYERERKEAHEEAARKRKEAHEEAARKRREAHERHERERRQQ